MAKKKKEEIIIIPKPKFETIEVTVVGTSVLNVHRLGKKLTQEFEDRDKNKPKQKKGPRDYQYEYRDSLYVIDKDGNDAGYDPKNNIPKSARFGFPSSAFKKAMIYAARQFDNIAMTEVRGRVFVNPTRYYTEIIGKPRMDMFWRRIGSKGPGTGTPDRGIRASFDKWSAKLSIQFLANQITAESVIHLLAVAGFSVGIGEDRPDKNGGTGGMWAIEGN